MAMVERCVAAVSRPCLCDTPLRDLAGAWWTIGTRLKQMGSKQRLPVTLAWGLTAAGGRERERVQQNEQMGRTEF
ncbi:hypothetical protein E2C01_028013 [Portunus trituberculatus]|uniref:Uncharacterized protein n=1 Tax=Portunus trituberculatus TaxID=210409 RepID=A0A5B7EN77_PORTR|nr:hypothetical protein [Portunus trituberculatus]